MLWLLAPGAVVSRAIHPRAVHPAGPGPLLTLAHLRSTWNLLKGFLARNQSGKRLEAGSVFLHGDC